MAESVQTAPNGVAIVPSNLDQTFELDGNGNVIKISVVFDYITYTQTITRDGAGNVTAISRWTAES